MKWIFSWFDALNSDMKKYKKHFSEWQFKKQILSDAAKVKKGKDKIEKTKWIIAGSAELLQKINPEFRKMVKKYKNNKKFWEKLKNF